MHGDMFKKKLNQQIHFHMCGNRCLFMWGAYFCMRVYKRDVLVVIKMCAYMHGAYFLWVLIILILQYLVKVVPY